MPTYREKEKPASYEDLVPSTAEVNKGSGHYLTKCGTFMTLIMVFISLHRGVQMLCGQVHIKTANYSYTAVCTDAQR